jgi:antitoxin VapB
VTGGYGLSLTVNHPDADRLAQELVERTGETVDEAVAKALRERLARTCGSEQRGELLRIGQECAALPDHDRRKPDEILG